MNDCINLTSFLIKNRNCEVVNFGIREYERQAWLQRKYERDSATKAYLQRTRKKFILEELANSSETDDMRKIR